MLEPYEGKLSRTVLRGEGGSNTADLLDRPSDLAQRAGRIVRQGNDNKEVHIYRYVTEKTFDAYLWQTVETKQRFISQIMTSKTPLRTCEDLDATALSFAEIKALCAGDPLIKEKTDLELDIRKLRVLQSEYKSQHYKLEDNILTHYPRRIKATQSWIAGLELDQRQIKEHTCPNDKGFSPMLVGKKEYADKEQAGKALLLACKTIRLEKGKQSTEPVKIGSYRGLDMELTAHRQFATNDIKYTLTMTGAMHYEVDLGGDVFGNITRINNELGSIVSRITDNKAELEDIQKQIANARTELARPFAHQTELEEKVARLAEVDTLLDLDKSEPDLMDDEPKEPDRPEEKQAEHHEMAPSPTRKPVAGVAKNTRPSILNQLRNLTADNPPHDKGKTANLTI